MAKQARVLGADIFRGEAIVVTFSDGTAAVVTVDDLLSFAPVRYKPQDESASADAEHVPSGRHSFN